MSFKRISFFGLPLDVNGSADDICNLVGEKNPASFITILEPDAWHLAKNNPEYVENLNKLSTVVTDGRFVAFACQFFTRLKCQSMSFDMTSLAKPFFQAAVKAKASIAIVGGQPRDDEDVQEKLKKYFPGIEIVETTHGFGEFAPKIELILAKKPKIVIAAIGAPRQEAFLLALRDAGFKGVAIGCGRFIDHYVEPVDYNEYPEWVDQYHLAPLYRLYREPQRLWQRYIFQYGYFAVLVVKGLFGMLTDKGENVATRLAKK
ncbi:MAG TPA: WecB/TagA/CpsF family glycosyltransferase [Alphaproteobacteria bacterium]|nr:WecB/TagA/CpsF family glycosyltransferase [Alphaproteobacteria bacterium]